MDVSALTIRLIFLLVPGALAALLVDKLTEHQKWSAFAFVIHSFLLGVAAYAVHQAGLWILGLVLQSGGDLSPSFSLRFWESLFDSSIPISVREVSLTSLVAVLVAVVISAAINHKWLFRTAKRLGISSKFGDEDLWAYFLNAQEVDWVWVRDHDRGVIYEGWLQAFSVTPSVREALLREVRVFDNDSGTCLYEVPAVYVCGEASKVSVELPPAANNQEDKSG